MPRYIDANVLCEEILGSYINSGIKIMKPGAYKTANEILDMIQEQPVIDPVRHGHWVKHMSGEFATCNVCWKESDFPEMIGDRGRYNEIFAYCPYCGAKMDIENGNDRPLVLPPPLRKTER